ncbi:hypothetical protein KFE98_11575 [bacterium SCSIO 12741]|nr:hypothetical protein KFE98_11575 [bacterium SCSIO 12741]
MKRTIFIFTLFALSFQLAFAQRTSKNANSKRKWNFYRHELIVGVGGSNYLGELGGNPGPAANFSPKDVEISMFRPCFSLGYRYNIDDRFAIRPQFFYGRVGGSDALTENEERKYRNLEFTSNIFELAVLGEYHILRANYGRGFYQKSVIGKTGQKFAASAHLGVGFFYFNPKYGSVALQPLGTEGQGVGGTKKYSRLAIAFPVGVSGGYMITRSMQLGLDLTYRFTTTDYLDDASTVYFDKEEIRKANGDLAAEMSDRTDGSRDGWSEPGSPRGNPDRKDSYFSVAITWTYAPFIHIYKKPKRKVRPKF